VNLNGEVIITPFPGAGNDRTLRMFGFVDVGNVFGEKRKFDRVNCARPSGWA
jgi:outer membrane protein insertion porin family